MDDIPISELSLAAKLPQREKIYRSMTRMRSTINSYVLSCAKPRFWASCNLGTLHSLSRRFADKAPSVAEQTTVEMQIGYKQLAERLSAYISLYKLLKTVNDSQNFKNFGAAAKPLAVLFKFLQASPGVVPSLPSFGGPFNSTPPESDLWFLEGCGGGEALRMGGGCLGMSGALPWHFKVNRRISGLLLDDMALCTNIFLFLLAGGGGGGLTTRHA